MKYQWTLNGANLAAATNDWLTLTNIHVSQAGKYAVKVTTPDGNITSSNALVTVIPVTILEYAITGQQTYAAGGQSLNYGYSGELLYLPSGTNGTVIEWGMVNGKKRYWLETFGGYTRYSIAGAGAQSFTVFEQQGQNTDGNGNPSFWSVIIQGANAALAVGGQQVHVFPPTLSGALTDVYPDPNTGKYLLDEASSTYTFAPGKTQAVNNTGQTVTDLINAQIKTLTAQGYTQSF